jgi:hypothetical protein
MPVPVALTSRGGLALAIIAFGAAVVLVVLAFGLAKPRAGSSAIVVKIKELEYRGPLSVGVALLGLLIAGGGVYILNTEISKHGTRCAGASGPVAADPSPGMVGQSVTVGGCVDAADSGRFFHGALTVALHKIVAHDVLQDMSIRLYAAEPGRQVSGNCQVPPVISGQSMELRDRFPEAKGLSYDAVVRVTRVRSRSADLVVTYRTYQDAKHRGAHFQCLWADQRIPSCRASGSSPDANSPAARGGSNPCALESHAVS